MAPPLSARWRGPAIGLSLLLPLAGWAQNTFVKNGTQYWITGGLTGDQIRPQVALGSAGGYVVWQDNVTDGDGSGISARRIDRNGVGNLGVFRVNQQGAGDQENPQVVVTSSGSAAFVWQGVSGGSRRIHARFTDATGQFVTEDIAVSASNHQQQDPVATSLSDGSLVVLWSSHGQDGSLQGVFGQRFAANGTRLGGEFQVNQSVDYNQRTPVVAPTTAGGFAAVWISESGSDISGVFHVDVVGRMYDAAGPVGNEFRINSGTNICANPSVGATADGGFLVAWGQLTSRVGPNGTDSWDILARTFDAGGRVKSSDQRLNSHTYGDQFAARVAGGRDYMVVWTSLQQDGSMEGVFGRFVDPDGALLGDELQVNTATANRQFTPTVTAVGEDSFLALWSGYLGGAQSFEVFGQRYDVLSSTIPAPAAPVVSAISSTRLSVAWAAPEGLAVDRYELLVDGAATPVPVTANYHTLTGLAPASTHTVRLAFVLEDGRRSAVSEPGTGRTWGEDANFDGLADDWQSGFWGSSPANWPAPQADSDGDGATNLQEFQAGTNPADPDSVLRTQLVATAQGTRLGWNTQPGMIYQVQSSVDLKAWGDVGTPRFAAGASDSMLVEGANASAYYRILRLR